MILCTQTLASKLFNWKLLLKPSINSFFEYPNPEEILILVSGDLAHIGPRFGDEEDAKIYFEGVSVYDTKFLKCIADLDYNGLLKLMRSNNDAFNHCGFPPALLALKCYKYYLGRRSCAGKRTVV